MIVKDIMKTEVATCTFNDDVATAATVMHDRRCGFVPVIDSRGAVAGVLTDRDVCLGAATERNRTASHIAVQKLMSQPVFSCFAEEDLKVALTTMAAHRVRRLPVLDSNGHLTGVLSIDDIVLAPRRKGAPTPSDVVAALKKIVEPRVFETSAS